MSSEFGLSKDSDLDPRITNSLLYRLIVKFLSGDIYCGFRESLEIAGGFNLTRNHGLVPHLASLFPGIPTKRFRSQIEGMIRDTGVDMNASTIISSFLKIVHMLWLRVSSEDRVVCVCFPSLEGS
jgi:hypothetical protein